MRRALPRLPFLIALAGAPACAPEGPSAFVTYNLAPNANCVVEPEGEAFIPIGLYDISPGGDGTGRNCEWPYFLNLQVNSFLRPNSDPDLGRAEPNILQIHSAEVHLMTVERSTILFDRVDPPLPNPFLVTVNNTLFPTDGTAPSPGIAAVEAIPVNYASQLNGFTNKQIMAEIQVFGTTTGDVDVDFKPFVYAIQICDGCLSACIEPFRDPATGEVDQNALNDFLGDGCQDNSGSDGRICIDPDC